MVVRKLSVRIRRVKNLFGEVVPCLREGCECLLGVFGDSHCNCENERENALSMIGEKLGVYIHTPQEAQGQGLFYKAQELHLQVNGIMPDGTYVGPKTQSEAAELLGQLSGTGKIHSSHGTRT